MSLRLLLFTAFLCAFAASCGSTEMVELSDGEGMEDSGADTDTDTDSDSDSQSDSDSDSQSDSDSETDEDTDTGSWGCDVDILFRNRFRSIHQ